MMKNSIKIDVHFYFKLIFSIAVLLIFACSKKIVWDGHYHYQDQLGQNNGGIPLLIDYELVLRQEYCELGMQGYQVAEKLLCSTVEEGKVLQVKFTSYANGKITNVYDVAVYKPGEILFILEKSEEKSDPLITHWHALKPDAADNASGVYFQH